MDLPPSSPTIDLNADVGESFGIYRLGADNALMATITSANVACGVHAGDPAVMRRTVRLALAHGVRIGAHPGLPDREGFGRREMAITPAEIRDLCLYQIGALAAFVRSEGGRLRHVKPHGALYTMAARDAALADAVAEAVARYDDSLRLFGLSGSELIRAGERFGLRTVSEVFADRAYRADGALMPRSDPRALLPLSEATRQAVELARSGWTATLDGDGIELRAETLCLHGDGAEAVALARAIRAALTECGIAVAAPFQ